MIKRITIFAIFIFIFITIFSFPVFAVGEDKNFETEKFFEEEKENLTSKLPEDSRSIIEDFSDDGTLEKEPNNLIKGIFLKLLEESKAPLNALISIISILLISSLLEGLKSNKLSATTDLFDYIAVLAISVSVIIPIINLIQNMSKAITEAGEFVKFFIPVFAGIMLAGGERVTANGYQIIALSASELVSAIAEHLILPVLSIFLALSIISSGQNDGFDLSKLTKSLKSMVMWTLTFITTFYCGLLSVHGIIGTTADTYTTKTAKFLISNSVPAIGNALSDALSSVHSGLKMMKGSVGIIGIIAPIIIVSPFLLKIFAWQISIKSGEMISGLLRNEKAEKLMSAVSSVIGLLISISLLLTALLIITTTIIIMIGGR